MVRFPYNLIHTEILPFISLVIFSKEEDSLSESLVNVNKMLFTAIKIQYSYIDIILGPVEMLKFSCTMLKFPFKYMKRSMFE